MPKKVRFFRRVILPLTFPAYPKFQQHPMYLYPTLPKKNQRHYSLWHSISGPGSVETINNHHRHGSCARTTSLTAGSTALLQGHWIIQIPNHRRKQDSMGHSGQHHPALGMSCTPNPVHPHPISGAPTVLWPSPTLRHHQKVTFFQTLPCSKHQVALAHGNTLVPGPQARKVRYTAFHIQGLRTRGRHY